MQKFPQHPVESCKTTLTTTAATRTTTTVATTTGTAATTTAARKTEQIKCNLQASKRAAQWCRGYVQVFKFVSCKIPEGTGEAKS